MRGKSPTCRQFTIQVAVYDRLNGVGDPRKKKCSVRQVGDLPRIGVAEPVRKFDIGQMAHYQEGKADDG